MLQANLQAIELEKDLVICQAKGAFLAKLIQNAMDNCHFVVPLKALRVANIGSPAIPSCPAPLPQPQRGNLKKSGQILLDFWFSGKEGSQNTSAHNVKASFDSLPEDIRDEYLQRMLDKLCRERTDPLGPDEQDLVFYLTKIKEQHKNNRSSSKCKKRKRDELVKTVPAGDVKIINESKMPRRSSRIPIPSIWTRCMICNQ